MPTRCLSARPLRSHVAPLAFLAGLAISTSLQAVRTTVPPPKVSSAPAHSPAAPAPAQAPAVKPDDPWLEPIQVPARPYLGADFKKQVDAWYDLNVTQPFLKRLPADKPCSAPARDYIKKAVDRWVSQLYFKDVSADGKNLIALGCDDPLVAFFNAYFTSYVSKDDTADVDAAKAAFKRLDEDKYYSPAVVRLAGMAANDVSQHVTASRSIEIERRVTELAKESMLAGNYPGDDDYLFMLHTKAWAYGWNHFINNFDDEAASFDAAKVPDWVQHCLRGFIEVKRAWDRRGPGMANTVSQNGWLGFNDLYNLACDDYTVAWKLRPTRPDAASEMIGITMAGHGNPGDTMRLWFDRAVAAQFDFIPAYDAVAWGLRPRWGGSLRQMVEFARLCAETRQFDTEVPGKFFSILENACEETDWRAVYRSPVASAVVVPTAFGIADSPVRREKWKQQYSLAAVEAYFVGDGPAAADALNKAGGELQQEAKDLLYRRAGDFDKMKQEIAVLQTPAGKRFWDAEQLYDAGQLESAIAAFDDCETALTVASNPLSSVPAGRAKALRLEKALAGGGDWVKIPLEAGLWRFERGNWKVTDNGALEVTAGNGNAMAIASPILGGKLELRCEVEIDSPTKDKASVGVVLGEHGTGYYVVCGFKQNEGIDSLQASATDHWQPVDSRVTGVTAQKTNEFLIQVAGNHVTYHLNGIPVVTHWEGNDSPVNKPYSRIGLAVRDLRPGTTIRVLSVEVRTKFNLNE